MSDSIERRLSRMLGLVVVAAGLSAAAVNFFVAYRGAQEFQDGTLRHLALLVSRPGWNPEAEDPVEKEAGTDAASRLIIAREPPGRIPDWIPRDLPPGFHTLAYGTESMRVFVRDNPGGERVVIAQATDLRSDIAFDSALPNLVPLLLMVPLLLLVTGYIVRGELARVRKLAESVDRSPPDRLEVLPTSNVPLEVGLFVSAINRLITRVNRLLEQQRRFIADAAHELRSPLTAIALQAKNVENAGSLETVRERMLALRGGIQRAQRLSEQLLNLARIEAEARTDRIDVSRLTREMIEEYQPLAQERGIDLGLEERERVEVTGAPEALRAILKNALDNALTYTPANGEVTVRLLADDKAAIIMEVLDTGPGIPMEERERVFAPFYRIPGTPGEGSGLGLAIARDAAMRLGGSIRIEERNPGPGLVFQYRQNHASRIDGAPAMPLAGAS
jgi:two-component system, OmpR family, sensor kinase